MYSLVSRRSGVRPVGVPQQEGPALTLYGDGGQTGLVEVGVVTQVEAAPLVGDTPHVGPPTPHVEVVSSSGVAGTAGRDDGLRLPSRHPPPPELLP